jgi:hypothetical protein
MNVLAFFALGPMEIILGLVCFGVLGGIVALVVVLTTKKAPVNPNLAPCPDCGRPISPLAETCPHCGRPLSPKDFGDSAKR